MAAVRVGARREALRKSSRGAVASPRVQVSEMQRARLLAAAAATISELGYPGASVAHIAARARVSRRTFYDLFASREDCLLAVLEDAVRRISGEIAGEDLTGLAWRERVRGGLLAILSFFDREPVLAHMCVVQALQGGPRVLRWREGILANLAEVIDQGRAQSGSRSRECTSLTAEGLVGAALAIVHARLAPVSTGTSGQGGAGRSIGREGARSRTYANDRGRRPIVWDRPAPPLVALLGELMSLIVLLYQGPAAARQERRRSLPPVPAATRAAVGNGRSTASEQDPLRKVPMRLTYRTALVLKAVAEHPGDSNRHIGEQADIYDQGQISKLLGRLERIGLLANTGVGHTKGEPNAWRLTALGERVTEQLSLSVPRQEDIA